MTFSQAILLLLPICLVFALEKITFFGVPVYFLEGLFLVFISSTVWKIKSKNLKVRLRSLDRWVLMGVGLFVCGAIASTLGQSEVSLTSLGQLKSWFLFPALFALWLYIQSEGKQEERKLLYLAWLIGTGVIGLVAWYGYFSGILTYDTRLAFPYNSANFLAFLTAPGVLIASFFLLRVGTWLERITLGVLVGTLLAVLYFTHSYNTWLALTISFLGLFSLVGILKGRLVIGSKLTIFMIGSVLLLSVFFFLEYDSAKWQDLISMNGRSSLDSRVMIWQSAKSILQDHFMLGIGVGNFQREYLVYQVHFIPYLEWAVPQPHNLLVAVWLQTGLVGLVGFVLLVGRLISLLCMRVYESIQNKNRDEGVLLLGLWVLFLCYGLFDTPYFRNDLAYLFWFQALLTYWYIEAKEDA